VKDTGELSASFKLKQGDNKEKNGTQEQTAVAQMNCCFMWQGMDSLCLLEKSHCSPCLLPKKIKLKVQKNWG